MVPPLVGIRASRKSNIQKGHPLVIEVKDPEYASLFDSGSEIPPVIVACAHGDKKVCGTIYNELILNKFCELRKSSLWFVVCMHDMVHARTCIYIHTYIHTYIHIMYAKHLACTHPQ